MPTDSKFTDKKVSGGSQEISSGQTKESEARETRDNVSDTVSPHTEQARARQAEKRNISRKQWGNLEHVASSANKSFQWIDETFIFEGGGKIKVKGDLDLSNCESLTELPEQLTIIGSLDLSGCKTIQHLPRDLKVGTDLGLDHCVSLESLPSGLEVPGDLSLMSCNSLEQTPMGLKVGGNLYLNNCEALQAIQAGLDVGRNLDLNGCTALEMFSENICINGNVYISKDFNPLGKKQIERLKLQEKIGGEIICDEVFIVGTDHEKDVPGFVRFSSDRPTKPVVPKKTKAKDNGNLNCKIIETQSVEQKKLQEAAFLRGIRLEQWVGLLHLASAMGETKDWISKTFRFERGKIKAKQLSIRHCPRLITLPGELETEDYIQLVDCASLIFLPEDISVGSNCRIVNCPALGGLPGSLKADRLILSHNLQEQVKKDAESLRQEKRVRKVVFMPQDDD